MIHVVGEIPTYLQKPLQLSGDIDVLLLRWQTVADPQTAPLIGWAFGGTRPWWDWTYDLRLLARNVVPFARSFESTVIGVRSPNETAAVKERFSDVEAALLGATTAWDVLCLCMGLRGVTVACSVAPILGGPPPMAECDSARLLSACRAMHAEALRVGKVMCSGCYDTNREPFSAQWFAGEQCPACLRKGAS